MRKKTTANMDIVEQIMQLDERERDYTLMAIYDALNMEQLKTQYVVVSCRFEHAMKKAAKQKGVYVEHKETKHNGFRVVKYG